MKAPCAKKQSRRWRFPLWRPPLGLSLKEEQFNRGASLRTSATSPIRFEPHTTSLAKERDLWATTKDLVANRLVLALQ